MGFMFERRKDFFAVALLLLFSVIVFHGTLFNYFTNWDDTFYFSFDGIRNFDMGAMFTTPLLNNYFPFTLLGYAVDTQICYPEAWCFHLSSLLLHLANITLLFFLLRRLFKENFFLALIPALLFAVHPMQVESIAWMSAKNYPQSYLFLLATLHFFISWRETQRKIFYALALISFALGLLSKHAVFITPLVMLAFDYFYFQRRRVLDLVPFFAGSLAAGMTAVGLYRAPADLVMAEASLPVVDRVLFFMQSLLFYAGKVVVPVDLSAFYDSERQPFFWYDYGAVLFFAALGAAGLWKGLGKDRRWLLLASVSAVVLFPFIKLVSFSSSSSYNDRYMYYFLGFGGAWMMYSLWKLLPPKIFKSAAFCFVAVSLVYAGLARERVRVWENPSTLWTDVLLKNPQSDSARFKLAELYYGVEDWAAALEQTRLGITIGGKYQASLYYLQAQCYEKTSQLDQAVSDLRRSLQLDPDFAPAKAMLKRLGKSPRPDL
jgi:hypothetical protein